MLPQCVHCCNWWGPTALSWEVVQGCGGRVTVLVAGFVNCVRPELARLPHVWGFQVGLTVLQQSNSLLPPTNRRPSGRLCTPMLRLPCCSHNAQYPRHTFWHISCSLAFVAVEQFVLFLIVVMHLCHRLSHCLSHRL